MIWSKNIGFFDMAIKDGEGWFINAYYGAIYRLDLADFNLKLETMLEPQFRAPYFFANVAFRGNTLIAAPRGGNAILLYDTVQRSIRTIEIEKKYIPEDNMNNLIMGIEIYKDCAVLFPGTCRAILFLDMSNMEIEYVDYWDKKLNACNTRSVMFRHVRRIDDSRCLLPTFQHGFVFEFDLAQKKGEYTQVNCIEDCLIDILPFEERYIVSFLKSQKLLLWDKDNGKTEPFVLCDKNGDGNGIRDIISANGYLYCVDTRGDRLHVIDTASRTFIKTITVMTAQITKSTATINLAAPVIEIVAHKSNRLTAISPLFLALSAPLNFTFTASSTNVSFDSNIIKTLSI